MPHIMISSRKRKHKMKHLTTIALMLSLGTASVYAQQTPIKMTFSGTGAPSAVDLKYPNTNNGEEILAGSGTLGSFTFRMVEATASAPQPSSTCTGLYFQTVAGAGLFRFQDGSLSSPTERSPSERSSIKIRRVGSPIASKASMQPDYI